jgi:hypothetical protein
MPLELTFGLVDFQGKLPAEKAEGQDKKNLSFRKLLLSKCQKEFEKDYMDGMTEEKKNANLEAATTPEAK